MKRYVDNVTMENTKQIKSNSVGTRSKTILASLPLQTKKASPTSNSRDINQPKQPRRKILQKKRSSDHEEESNHSSKSRNDCKMKKSPPRWNRWSWVEQESVSGDTDTDGDKLYHILDSLDDSLGSLDVSDSKRLSLMDVLLKDELSLDSLKKR